MKTKELSNSLVQAPVTSFDGRGFCVFLENDSTIMHQIFFRVFQKAFIHYNLGKKCLPTEKSLVVSF